MFFDLYEMQAYGLNRLDAVTAATGAAAKALRTMADEAIGFSEKRFETSCALSERMARARKFEELFELQSDFAKAACEDFIVQAKTFSDLYFDLARDAFGRSKLRTAGWSVGRRFYVPSATQAA